jgi:hypothetical protein
MNDGHESLDEDAVVQMSELWLIVKVLNNNNNNNNNNKIIGTCR